MRVQIRPRLLVEPVPVVQTGQGINQRRRLIGLASPVIDPSLLLHRRLVRRDEFDHAGENRPILLRQLHRIRKNVKHLILKKLFLFLAQPRHTGLVAATVLAPLARLPDVVTAVFDQQIPVLDRHLPAFQRIHQPHNIIQPAGHLQELLHFLHIVFQIIHL